MIKAIFLLFVINTLTAMGYSLIAPFYPTLALQRNVSESVCGVVFAMFAVSNFFATPFCPSLISKYGRKNMFYFAMSLEVYNN